MTRFDGSTADCIVNTRKEGVLSAMGHDLVLRVTSFEIVVEGTTSVRARFDASSLKVVGAMSHGTVRTDLLSRRDVESIEKLIDEEVLRASKFPNIEFASSSVTEVGGDLRVTGSLSLCGASRELQVVVNEGRRCGVVLDQRWFGITPYRAPLGVLRVAPEVMVEVTLH